MRIESDEKARKELLAFLREWGIDGSKVCVDDWDLDGYYELRTTRTTSVWRTWPKGFPGRKFYRMASRVTGLL